MELRGGTQLLVTDSRFVRELELASGNAAGF